MASASPDPDPSALLDGARALLDDCVVLAAARGVGPGARPGWAITAAFYAALHAISAYVLVRHNERVNPHQDRSHWFKKYPELAGNQLAFTSLKKQSEAFRYDFAPYTWDDADRSVAAPRQIVAKWAPQTRRRLPSGAE